MKYLIASDVDRTIIKNYKTDISKNTKKIIKKLRKNGNIFVIASGRPLFNIKRLYGKNCDYLVGSNGASIYDMKKRKIIYENKIEKQRCLDILSLIGNDYRKYCICTSKGWNMKVHGNYKRRHKEEKLIKNIDKLLNENILKFEIYYNSYERLDEVENLLKKYKDIEVIKSIKGEKVGGCLDIFTKGNDKYNALKMLCELENIPNNQLICFGDNMNDLNMLKKSGISIAVSNADERVINVADYITSTSGNEGVYKWLNEHFDLEKNEVIK